MNPKNQKHLHPRGRIRAHAVFALPALFALTMGVSGVTPVYAWTDRTRARMTFEASRLAPPALSRLMQRHEADCRQGVLTHDDEITSHVATGPEALNRKARALRDLVDETVEAINEHEPVRTICQRLCRIGHLAADLNHPLHTGAAPGALDDYYAEYGLYAEEVMGKAPLVFYGWRDGLDENGGVERYAERIARRSSMDGQNLHRAFYPGGPAGNRVSSRTFDDRSVPFAIASLSYSRAVSDIANLWYHVWSSAGGDVRGTPYRAPADAADPADPADPADLGGDDAKDLVDLEAAGEGDAAASEEED